MGSHFRVLIRRIFERIVSVHLPKILNRLHPGPSFRVTHVSAAGIGSVTIQYPDGSEDSPTFRTMVSELLALKQYSGGLLFSIDEVNAASAEEFSVFAGEYQHLIHEDQEVAFEAFKHPISSRGRAASDEVLDHMTRASQGYPFLIQSIGDLAWRYNHENDEISMNDARHGHRMARGSMGSFIHEPALSGLSPKNRSFLIAMAHDEDQVKLKTFVNAWMASIPDMRPCTGNVC